MASYIRELSGKKFRKLIFLLISYQIDDLRNFTTKPCETNHPLKNKNSKYVFNRRKRTLSNFSKFLFSDCPCSSTFKFFVAVWSKLTTKSFKLSENFDYDIRIFSK